MTQKKTAGRRPAPTAKKFGPEFIGKTPDADAKQEIAVRRRRDQVIEQFGDGLSYVREHSLARIRVEMTRTMESILACGRELLVMKAHEPHGEWLGCLRSIGLGEDNAERMMAAARRIDALPKNRAAARNLLTSAGAPSKLFDMLALSDDELEKIAGGDTEIDPEDIEHMTRSELRAALREVRGDKAALDERNAKLQQTAERAELAAAKAKRSWKEATPDEQLTLLRRELDSEALHLSIRIVSQDEAASSLYKRVAALIEHGEQHGHDHKVYLAGVFAQLERYLHQVRDEFYIPHLAIGDPALEAQAMIGPAKK